MAAVVIRISPILAFNLTITQPIIPIADIKMEPKLNPNSPFIFSVFRVELIVSINKAKTENKIPKVPPRSPNINSVVLFKINAF